MTVVGYTFNAENYCVDCTRGIAKQITADQGSATIWSDGGLVESILTEGALLMGIDRTQEDTFDSGDFPKVLVNEATAGYVQAPPGERCGKCHMKLDYGDDPNDEEFWKDFERFSPEWAD